MHIDDVYITSRSEYMRKRKDEDRSFTIVEGRVRADRRVHGQILCRDDRPVMRQARHTLFDFRGRGEQTSGISMSDSGTFTARTHSTRSSLASVRHSLL